MKNNHSGGYTPTPPPGIEDNVSDVTTTDAPKAWEFYDKIITDKRLSHGAVRHCLNVRRYMNRKTGKAWPGQRKLVKDIQCDSHSIKPWNEEIEAAGYWVVSKNPKGRSHTLLYSFTDVVLGKPTTRRDVDNHNTVLGKPTTRRDVDNHNETFSNEPSPRTHTPQSPPDVGGEVSSSAKFGPEFDDARRVLSYLNEKAGTRYEESAKSLTYIFARLQETNNDVPGIFKMIDSRCTEWLKPGGTTREGRPLKMLLSVTTLFGPSGKFEDYYAQRDVDTSNQQISAAELKAEISQLDKEAADIISRGDVEFGGKMVPAAKDKVRYKAIKDRREQCSEMIENMRVTASATT